MFMKTSAIAKKYSVNIDNFELFLKKNNLKYTKKAFGGYEIDDNDVENYVKQYRVWIKNGGKGSAKKQASLDNIEIIDTYNSGLEKPVDGAIYSINGVRGRHIDVFDNKCIIKTKVTIGSLLTHNATDGTKTIYYADVVGVQFKEPGITIGYLQLETPGLTMNNAASNFFNENSFTFDTTVITTEKMREIAAYIEERVQEIKHPKQQPQTVAPAMPQISVADELLKFKQLLDMGALTQEEFDAKKKELLNL